MAIDQNKLNPELAQWLAARQSALKIVKTTTTPSGQTLDWVPIESQVRDGKIASPPPVTPLPVGSGEKDKPVTAVTLELDDPKVERGPAGTVPVVRPSFSHLTTTLALKDFLKKSGGTLVNKNRPNKKPTDPNPFGYFHGTDGQNVTAFGCDFIANVWDPKIDLPSAPGDDHSILQTWLQCYNPKFQSIEGGWTVDQNLNGDTQPHIFTYYTTNGYAQDGNNLGGYNTTVSGFVQVSNAVFPGIRINGISAYGVSPQKEVSMKFQLYREPTNGQLNWWVACQGTWMGYYPASLFDGGVGNEVQWVAFGGEVFSSLSNPALTKDQMGSGTQAQGGWTHAAYMRNLRNQSNLAGTMVNNDGTASSDTGTGSGANPYDIRVFDNSGSSWGSYLFVGGPTPYTG
jgi:hypothetical protein